MNYRNKTKTRLKRRELVSDIYDKKVFSKNFRKYFDKSGMTKRKFLNIVGAGKSSFYNWFGGKKIPYMRNIEAICGAFKINVKDLMVEEIK